METQKESIDQEVSRITELIKDKFGYIQHADIFEFNRYAKIEDVVRFVLEQK